MNTVPMIFAITAIVSILIAIFLAIISQLSSQPKDIIEKSAQPRVLDTDPFASDDLRHAIFSQVHEVIGSERICREISDRLSLVFAQELRTKINTTSKELDNKYRDVIEDEKRSEEMAWNKYKGLLTEHNDTVAVMKSIAEGLVVVNSSGNVVMMNPAAEKLLGVSRKDKMGRPIIENVAREQLVSMIKSGPEGEDKEIEMFSQKDETKKILRSSNAVIEDQNGQTVGLVSVLSDVTKQRELDSFKESFVSNITHDLRTPLIASQKALNLIHDAPKTGMSEDEEKEFLSLAQNNLDRLGRMISDLLDLSSLQEAKIKLKPAATQIESVIDDSVETVKAWAEAKEIKIEKSLGEDIPDIVMDGKRIGQVLNNLLGNAVKFTGEKGSITVDASYDKALGELTVAVSDTGKGIPQESLGKIFDRFYQTGERVPTKIDGTGIGLSIVKELVELHGGTIWAESEEGRGAKFIFKIKSA
ncbi:MAG: ATP-binding protein [Candidatus Omnitrophota bacterium]